MIARLSAAALAVVTVGLIAADWPRFRGPNGEGTADDKNVPVTWSTTENVVWKVTIPGQGNSSPVICGGRIYLQTASADGSKRSLLCLDAKTGETLWSHDETGEVAPTHAKNTLASSTPACDGERIYTLFWDGSALELVALDVNGKLLWRQDLGSFSGNHGAGHSPAVHDGKVFVNNDQDGSARVLAFEAKTGKPLWDRERVAFNSCYTTPFVREAKDGKKELIIASTAGVSAYDPDSGEIRWDWNWQRGRGKKELRMVGAPATHGELVFAYTGDGGGSREFVAIRAGDELDPNVERIAWTTGRGTPYVPCLLVHGDYLFGIVDGKAPQAVCMVAETGEVVWQERLPDTVTASPVIIDGKVYVTDEAGTTSVFLALPRYEELAQNPLNERVLASPAVADGKLYIRTATRLYCIGAE